MLFRFCLYGFLKNQRYFEPFLVLVFLDLGLSFFWIGVLIAIRDLTVNLLEIPSGAIADSVGRRGSMILSFVAYIISFVVLALSSSLPMLSVGMLLYGVGDTFRSGTHKAMIFEWLRLQNRSGEKAQIYGLTRSWSQIGSAVSGLIAAIFVLISGDYQYVFWFATLPCIANLINFAGYPRTLDGEHEKTSSPREIARRLWVSLKKSFARSGLRRLMVEAMAWEGYLESVKDYLQPVLQTVAIGLFAAWGLAAIASPDSTLPEAGMAATAEEAALVSREDAGQWLNEERQTALLVGPVYVLVFLLSAYASRHAHRVIEWSGGMEQAASVLWIAQAGLFLTLATTAWLNWHLGSVLSFVGLIALKNAWRPILISRFDELTDPQEGATVLSVESQARHGATLVAAPLMGAAVDWLHGEVWVVGIVGAMLSIAMWCSRRG